MKKWIFGLLLFATVALWVASQYYGGQAAATGFNPGEPGRVALDANANTCWWLALGGAVATFLFGVGATTWWLATKGWRIFREGWRAANRWLLPKWGITVGDLIVTVVIVTVGGSLASFFLTPFLGYPLSLIGAWAFLLLRAAGRETGASPVARETRAGFLALPDQRGAWVERLRALSTPSGLTAEEVADLVIARLTTDGGDIALALNAAAAAKRTAEAAQRELAQVTAWLDAVTTGTDRQHWRATAQQWLAEAEARQRAQAEARQREEEEAAQRDLDADVNTIRTAAAAAGLKLDIELATRIASAKNIRWNPALAEALNVPFEAEVEAPLRRLTEVIRLTPGE